MAGDSGVAGLVEGESVCVPRINPLGIHELTGKMPRSWTWRYTRYFELRNLRFYSYYESPHPPCMIDAIEYLWMYQHRFRAELSLHARPTLNGPRPFGVV